MTQNRKKYWVDRIVYSGVPGSDIHEALAQAFSDYYSNPEVKHEIQIKLNGVTITMKKDVF